MLLGSILLSILQFSVARHSLSTSILQFSVAYFDYKLIIHLIHKLITNWLMSFPSGFVDLVSRGFVIFLSRFVWI